MNKKERLILIVYDYFYPGYKAGGPIQSLVNMVVALQDEYNFTVLTYGYDLNTNHPYKQVRLNTWNEVLLPGMKKSIRVWYADKNGGGLSVQKQLIAQVKPDVVYLNGIYSFRFFLTTLSALRSMRNCGIVICPRGMLQRGALTVKGWKKRYYLQALKMSGLTGRANWHATNEEERQDIRRVFNPQGKIEVAGNVPKKPLSDVVIPAKRSGEIRLLYLSLITEKKNLLLLLQSVKELQGDIILHVYGPVKDEYYWQQCLQQMQGMPNVEYKGDVLPERVQATFADYHLMPFLTKGENFGHALYECLSAGRPVITSHFTPWHNLQAVHAGANVDIDKPSGCTAALKHFTALGQEEFSQYCRGAHRLATDYFNALDTTQQYGRLFGR